MQLANVSNDHISVTDRKKRRKRQTFFYTSAKALRRSRMKQKKVLSKIGETSLGEVRKALCFATGTSTRDGDVEVENAEDDGHVFQEDSTLDNHIERLQLTEVSICRSCCV